MSSPFPLSRDVQPPWLPLHRKNLLFPGNSVYFEAAAVTRTLFKCRYYGPAATEEGCFLFEGHQEHQNSLTWIVLKSFLLTGEDFLLPSPLLALVLMEGLGHSEDGTSTLGLWQEQ